jgi:hypothetical protein
MIQRFGRCGAFMPCGYLCPAGTGRTEPESESERCPIHFHMPFPGTEKLTIVLRQLLNEKFEYLQKIPVFISAEMKNGIFYTLM